MNEKYRERYNNYMREYMRKRRKDKGSKPRSSLPPPTKPDRFLYQSDPAAYFRQYNRWWRHNGHTARI